MKKKTLIGDRKEGGFKADREFDSMIKALKEKKQNKTHSFPWGRSLSAYYFIIQNFRSEI